MRQSGTMLSVMRIHRTRICTICSFILFTVLLTVLQHGLFQHSKHDLPREALQDLQVHRSKSQELHDLNVIHVAMVLCGRTKWHEATQLIKSILYFNPDPVDFHIITDHMDINQDLDKLLKRWANEIHVRINYTLYDEASMRNSAQHTGVPRNLFKPCAITRMYLHNLLHHLEWVLYFDTDILVLKPLRQLWDLREKFNSTHMVAAAHLEPILGGRGYWPGRTVPFPPPTGINSGMQLINLQKQRQMPWLAVVKEHYEKYKHFVHSDQDIYNAIFHFKPEYLLYVPPEWGFNSPYCRCDRHYAESKYKENHICQAIEKNGAYLVHGDSQLNVLPGNLYGIGQAFRKFHQCLSLKMNLTHRFERNIVPVTAYNYSLATPERMTDMCAHFFFHTLGQEPS